MSEEVLYNRARVRSYFHNISTPFPDQLSWLQGLLLMGAIFKSTKADETDEERRELERCVFAWTTHLHIKSDHIPFLCMQDGG